MSDSAFPVPKRDRIVKTERVSAHGDPDREDVLAANKDAVATVMLEIASSSITDIVTWDEDGKLQIKASEEVPDRVLRSVKKITATRKTYKNGVEENTIEVEMHDKPSMLRALAKGLGLLDPKKKSDAPSVFGITVKAPIGPTVKTKEEVGSR